MKAYLSKCQQCMCVCAKTWLGMGQAIGNNVPSVSKAGQSFCCCSMQSGHAEVWYNTLPAYCLCLYTTGLYVRDGCREV